MKAIILAAGKGTNLSPFSNTRPQPMIGVAGRTILDNSLELLKSSGINDIFVVVGHKREKLIQVLQDHDHNGQDKPRRGSASTAVSNFGSYRCSRSTRSRRYGGIWSRRRASRSYAHPF